MLVSLSSPEYTGIEGTNNNFILTLSVGYKTAGSEVKTAFVYAGYFYLKALLCYKLLKQ
jgi:hypothetical protein